MTIGPDPSLGARITSIPDTRAVLTTFASAGYTELDTARAYVKGQSESHLAAADYPSLSLTIATKAWPFNPHDHTLPVLSASLTASLAALESQSVDIFYLHTADRTTPYSETLAAVNELHKQGKFNKLGLSNFAAFEVAELVTLARERGWVVPSVYQAMYNPLQRKIEAELLPACRRYGLDVVIYNPLAGGLLTDRYTDPDPKEIPTEGRFSDLGAGSKTGQMYRDRFFTPVHFNAAKKLRELANKEGCTVVQLVMRWLVHHSALRTASNGGGNDGIIIGVSSKKQLEENIAAFEGGPLGEETAEGVDGVWGPELEGASVDYWRGELKYSYDVTDKKNW